MGLLQCGRRRMLLEKTAKLCVGVGQFCISAVMVRLRKNTVEAAMQLTIESHLPLRRASRVARRRFHNLQNNIPSVVQDEILNFG